MKSDLLNDIIEQEDAAREIASSIGGSGSPFVSADVVEQLARTVARLAQATRMAFEPIATSEFRRWC